MERSAQERTLLHALIDNIPDYVYVKDIESRFTVANQAVATLMGAKSAAEMIGKTDFDYYPKELAATFRKDEQEIISSAVSDPKRGNLSRLRGPRKVGGSLRKCRFAMCVGGSWGSTGTGRDITARKKADREKKRANEATEAANRAEHALDSERNLLRTLIDNIPDHIYLKDVASRFRRKTGTKGRNAG